ncbi:MAG: hypothetical protein E5V75_01585 [Mesorhizobium sp.]|nr:MAG: hypothetical protein E5V75_01585 [Mesorhizobium sp.]
MVGKIAQEPSVRKDGTLETWHGLWKTWLPGLNETANYELPIPFRSAPTSIFERRVLAADFRDFLPVRSDRLQQFALVGVSVSKNGHNHHRQNFSAQAQRIELFIRADLIEHAFANIQIERAKTGAIETPTQHLSAFQGPPFVLCGGPLLWPKRY